MRAATSLSQALTILFALLKSLAKAVAHTQSVPSTVKAELHRL
jgi:hypothetical protein